MATLKVSSFYLDSSYKREEILEKFEEALLSYLDEMDEDVDFDISLFIEELVESNNDFELIEVEDEKEEIDYEYTETKIYEIVDDALSRYEEESLEEEDDVDYTEETEEEE
jgi:hypothetical protein